MVPVQIPGLYGNPLALYLVMLLESFGGGVAGSSVQHCQIVHCRTIQCGCVLAAVHHTVRYMKYVLRTFSA